MLSVTALYAAPLGILLLGRQRHAWGLSREPEAMDFRTAGMALTFFALGPGVGAALWPLAAPA